MRYLFSSADNLNFLKFQIEELKAALSNKEYEMITECAQANISETPNIVPPLKDEPSSPSVDVSGQVISQVLDSTKSGTQYRETWIATKISVDIDLVELSLHYGVTRDASLATVQVVQHIIFLTCFSML